LTSTNALDVGARLGVPAAAPEDDERLLRRCSSSARQDAMSSGDGAPRAILYGPASATSTSSTSMSSGNAMTTGPGRPFIARWKAWLTISGMRRASSIWVTHLAIWPYMRR
jgi:hypothetical protein